MHVANYVRSNDMADQSDVVHLRLVMDRRNLDRAKQCGDDLAKMGFNVVHVNERGVDFRGQPGLVQKVFHQAIIKQDGNYRLAGKPQLPGELQDRAKGVYIPTRPTFVG